MSAPIKYVDVARFDAIHRNEVVAAAFACPRCLGLPPLGRIQSATDESFISCAPCYVAWPLSSTLGSCSDSCWPRRRISC